MATERDPQTPPLRDRLPADPALLAVVAVTLVALAARLYDLGGRLLHWDEGRVGYGILRYSATGSWEYRPIVHGPFLPHVNDVVFGVLGPSDFSARLVVALVGGLLPLSAWLFREHLRDSEVVALAGLFALNPILLYYSRFMRNDVLVGAFMLFALGFLVRTYDTRNPWYLYAASATAALGFTTKENALLYALCFAGGAALLLDHRLLWVTSRRLGRQVLGARPSATAPADAAADGTTDGSAADEGATADGGMPVGTLRWDVYARSRLDDALDALSLWWPALVLAVVEFLVILIFFYAPRGVEGPNGVGLYQVPSHPTALPALVEEALLGSWNKMMGTWGSGTHQEHAYLPFLEHYVTVLRQTAGVLSAFAVLGFLADRYSPEGPRDLVSLCGYWGLVSVLCYPVVTDLTAGWTVVHAVVPLAVPAAVGIGMAARWGRDAYVDDDAVGVALAVVVLVAATGTVGATAVQTSFDEPTAADNVLVQYGQPPNALGDTVEEMQAAVQAHGGSGPDVLFYGDHFYVENESEAYRLPVDNNRYQPGGPENNRKWTHRLPLPWYYEIAGADVDSVQYEADLATNLSANPPVVITKKCTEYWNTREETCVGANNAAAVRERLGDGYVEREHRMTTLDTRTVFFVRADLVDGE